MALIGQGRQDWQRTGGADSQLLVANAGFVLNTGPQTFGPFNVAGFWSLEGLIQLGSGGYLQVDINYYADQGRTQLLATRHLALDSNVSGLAQIFTPALGPWVAIVCTPITGATVWQSKMVISATTRLSSGLLAPVGNPLTTFGLLAVAAGATQQFNFGEVVGCPVTFNIGTTAAGVQPFVEAETANGAFSRVATFGMAGATAFTQSLVLPPLPCRLAVNNPTAAAISVLGAVIPSMTGAT